MRQLKPNEAGRRRPAPHPSVIVRPKLDCRVIRRFAVASVEGRLGKLNEKSLPFASKSSPAIGFVAHRFQTADLLTRQPGTEKSAGGNVGSTAAETRSAASNPKHHTERRREIRNEPEYLLTRLPDFDSG